MKLLHNPITTIEMANVTLYKVSDILDVVNNCRNHLSFIRVVTKKYPEEFTKVKGTFYTTRKGLLTIVKYIRSDEADEIQEQINDGKLFVI